MTFGEWWKANSFRFPIADYEGPACKELAKAAWNAAANECLQAIKKQPGMNKESKCQP